MKKSLMPGILLISLFSISLASALSLSETLSFIDPSFITLGLLFVVLFVLLNFSLSKVFKGSAGVPVIVAISISLLAVYWLNKSLSLDTLFSGLGISNELLYTAGPILFLIMAIFLFVKLRFGVFVVLGGIMILGSATGLVYSGTILTVIGIIFVVIGLIGMFSPGGRLWAINAKIRRIQRRYGQNDPRLRDLILKKDRIRPGIAGVKP